ncbi:MAG: hypothetical protein GY869_25695 [Planctomycetes bacterium]|nr:hypothetical protein [Planctomycetota bacterium]
MKKKIKVGFMIFFIVLIVLPIVWILWILQFIGGRPTRRVNYVAKMNELVRPAGATDDQNARSYYQNAIQMYVEPNDVISVAVTRLGRPAEDYYPWRALSNDEKNIVRQWIEEFEDEYLQIDDTERNLIQDLLEGGGNNSLESMPSSYPTSPLSLSNTENTAGMLTWEDFVEKYFSGLEFEETPEINSLYPLSRKISEQIISGAFPDEWHRGAAAYFLSQWVEQYETEERQIPQWIKLNEPSWRMLEAGNQKPYCWSSYDESGSMDDVLGSGMFRLKNVFNLGIWRAIRAQKNGQLNVAFDECLEVIETGRKLITPHDILILTFFGWRNMGFGIGEINQILSSEEVSSEEMLRVQKKLEEIFKIKSGSYAFESERFYFLEVVQGSFTEGGFGGGHLIHEAYEVAAYGSPYKGKTLSETFISLMEIISNNKNSYYELSFSDCLSHARRRETVAESNKLYDQLVALSKCSPFEQHNKSMIPSEDIEKRLPKKIYLMIYDVFTTVDDGALNIGHYNKAICDAAVTVLALKRWELDKGEFPEMLEELLEGGYLEELADDPYGPGVLSYRREGEDFILYSWYVDFDDDGGVGDIIWEGGKAGGDKVFWPKQK